ncbi:MAG: PQQ-binding-like beta-propeller repeat protein [Acidobacteria bacterium]|nr:PQQ-binding-like beta-propeller repeat protein [Acidobacteriota bacterium]
MKPKHALFLWAASTAMMAQDWPIYHGGYGNTKHSPLNQITAENAARLQLAWRFDTGEAGKDTEMQSNPLVIGGVMYVTSTKLRVYAVDARTGKQVWRFDPHGKEPSGKFRNRGLNYWTSGGEARLYFAAGPWLYALDAKTGRPAAEFGTQGRIDLREDLDAEAKDLVVTVTTPGVIYKDMLILGSLVSEGMPAAPGHIRAFDVRTGKRRWIFHTIPHPGEYGYKTWPKDGYKYLGGANAWGGLTLDAQRGLVFAPTGSTTYDFYGANRPGDNLFANCLIALDAATGKRKWHFQFVKHDLWDRDLPTAPTLVTVRRGGKIVDAVAQITKSGYVWVFERETGKSLFPFRQVKVAQSDVEGEWTAKTQPLPLKPEPFARQQFTEDLVTNRTPEAHADVLKRLKELRSGPQFMPPSKQGTVIFPGFDGGGEWGGATWDPETGLLYVNANEMAWIMKLVERKSGGPQTGKTLYARNCASCHRDDLKGSPPEFPALTQLAGRKSEAQVREVIAKGAGRMPGFARLQAPAIEAMVRFLMTGEDKEVTGGPAVAGGPNDLKYRLDGYVRFTDPDGYPAVKPPWGTLNALDLNTGKWVWRQPFGEIPALAEKGMKDTGSENYGGSVVTAGGVLFIGATNSDRKFRVFEKRTGKLLWEYTMDAAGNSTPATYMVGGKQYVVMGAGGGKWGNRSGGSFYAFALPE